MMTLISLGISVAYLYSMAVAFGAPGMPFFWELATLIVIMLLGHWLEMESVQGASRALEQLASLVPHTANRITAGGLEEVAVAVGDWPRHWRPPCPVCVAAKAARIFRIRRCVPSASSRIVAPEHSAWWRAPRICSRLSRLVITGAVILC